MIRFIQILTTSILFFLFLGENSIQAKRSQKKTEPQFSENLVFQEKPKTQSGKKEQKESPLKVMIHDLLEYLYYPVIPNSEAEDKKPTGKKKEVKGKKSN